MNTADMPYLMDRNDGGYANDYSIKVYEHIPTGSYYLIEKRNYVGSFQSMLNYTTDLMHRVSNMPSHAVAFNQDTGEEHKINQDGSYTILRERFDEGGEVEGSENKEMLENQAKNIQHHIEELIKVLKNVDEVEPWVITKAQRCVTDLADITHYLEGENEPMSEGEEMADGGEVKWQDAQLGDSALVVSENKMGVIIKPYGRKFHLKFVDGTEKTYDASELRFFGDVDDFDRGGMMAKGGEIRKGGYYISLTDNRNRFRIRDIQGNKVTTVSSKKDGTDVINYAEEKDNLEYLLEKGLIKKVNQKEYWDKKYEYLDGGMMEKGGKIYKIQVKDSDDLQPKWQDDTFYTGGKKYLSYGEAQKAVKKLQGDTAYYSKQFKVVEDKEKMAMGGKVTFDDKVAAIKKSLLKRKKVPKSVQKDYGKTFSPAEAEDSAKRIVGAMTAKERMMKSLKRRKK